MSSTTNYTLPPLPYAYDALEPYISKDIMTIHHTKHHQTYITNLNNFLQMQFTASSAGDLVKQLSLQQVINFHAGGHINHTLFWANLAPASSPAASPTCAPKVVAAISTRWGDLSTFQQKFNTALLSLRGSGWGWLVQDVESGALEIITSKDQEIVPVNKKPLLGVDFWEHAYYLQYLNDKAAYANGIWKVVNWETVEKRLSGNVDSVFGSLVGLKADL